VSVSHCLYASGAGRTPMILFVIRVDRDGSVRLHQGDGRLVYNVPVFGRCGDVKGDPPLRHISYNDFKFYANLTQGTKPHDRQSNRPYSIFTEPQLGAWGMTEKEPLPIAYKLKLGKIPMSAVAQRHQRDETAG